MLKNQNLFLFSLKMKTFYKLLNSKFQKLEAFLSFHKHKLRLCVLPFFFIVIANSMHTVCEILAICVCRSMLLTSSYCCRHIVMKWNQIHRQDFFAKLAKCSPNVEGWRACEIKEQNNNRFCQRHSHQTSVFNLLKCRIVCDFHVELFIFLTFSILSSPFELSSFFSPLSTFSSSN